MNAMLDHFVLESKKNVKERSDYINKAQKLNTIISLI
jgi:hypothetical protein